MTTQLLSASADPVTGTPMRRLFNSLSDAFFSICNFILCLLKLRPSAIQLENDALLEKLKSLEAAMTQEIHKETELQQVNSTLNETVTILETKNTKIEALLEQQEHRVCKGQDMVVELNERAKKLEKDLEILEKKKDKLHTRADTQKLLMETKTKELMCIADEPNQKKDSLQRQLNKKCELEEKHAWHIMAWETGLEQSQEIAKRLRSEKDKLTKSLSVLKQENMQLKDACSRLESECRDRIVGSL